MADKYKCMICGKIFDYTKDLRPLIEVKNRDGSLGIYDGCCSPGSLIEIKEDSEIIKGNGKIPKMGFLHEPPYDLNVWNNIKKLIKKYSRAKLNIGNIIIYGKNKYYTMKKYKEEIIFFILFIIFVLISLKMCYVSVDDMHNREPLYEIDNWR
jgi:hypothetical protein